MKIDHIGYAVRDIGKARLSFTVLGFRFEETVYEDMERNIYIQFGNKDGYRIELISPLGDGPSPVDTILRTMGAAPYHLCYVSENIELDIRKLEKGKFKVIIPLAKAVAFGGRRVVFMMNREIGMVEMVESCMDEMMMGNETGRRSGKI